MVLYWTNFLILLYLVFESGIFLGTGKHVCTCGRSLTFKLLSSWRKPNFFLSRMLLGHGDILVWLFAWMLLLQSLLMFIFFFNKVIVHFCWMLSVILCYIILTNQPLSNYGNLWWDIFRKLAVLHGFSKWVMMNQDTRRLQKVSDDVREEHLVFAPRELR